MGTPNSLKTVAGTPALQITHPARKANLVEERDVETTGTRDWSKNRHTVQLFACTPSTDISSWLTEIAWPNTR